MNLIGRPVRVISGDFAGQVGTVTEWTLGIFTVQAGNLKIGAKQSELQPLYADEEILNVRQVEVDDDGNEVDPEETHLGELVKPFGYTSADLADFQQEFIMAATGRIRGTGNEQYSSGTHQKFEELDINDMFESAFEEVLDMMNYLGMIYIRLERLRRGFVIGEGDDVADEDEEETEDA